MIGWRNKKMTFCLKMPKLPREIWNMILKEKSKAERRIRYKNAFIRLSLEFKPPSLERVHVDLHGIALITTMEFKAASLCIYYMVIEFPSVVTNQIMTTTYLHTNQSHRITWLGIE